jgi:hypothetical protein
MSSQTAVACEPIWFGSISVLPLYPNSKIDDRRQGPAPKALSVQTIGVGAPVGRRGTLLDAAALATTTRTAAAWPEFWEPTRVLV